MTSAYGDGARVAHRVEDGHVIVEIAGELDPSTVVTVEDTIDELLASYGQEMVFDLSGTTFLDSAGVNLLFELHTALRARGQRLELVVPSGNLIRRTLSLTVGEAFGLHETLEQALTDG